MRLRYPFLNILAISRVCILLSFFLIVVFSGCSEKSPEDKIKESFGDTSSWTILDWQKKETQLMDKLRKITEERLELIEKFNRPDPILNLASASDRKNIVEQQKQIIKNSENEETELRAQITFVRQIIAKKAVEQASAGSAVNVSNVSKKASEPENKINSTSTAETRGYVGSYSFNIPGNWKRFRAEELVQFRREYVAQSDEIYKQYSGNADNAGKSVEVDAFSIDDSTSACVLAVLSIPPQSNLITTLKSQVKEKAEWGVREGYIQKYLGLVSIDDSDKSGFCIKCIGKDGNLVITAGLSYTKRSNELVQMTLTCPGSWDEAMGLKTINALITSVSLK
jgi:hypothetical protein